MACDVFYRFLNRKVYHNSGTHEVAMHLEAVIGALNVFAETQQQTVNYHLQTHMSLSLSLTH